MRSPLMFFVVGVILAVSGCRTSSSSTFAYTHRITTGIGHCIVVDGATTPVVFSEQSDPIARWSLCHLRTEIADVSDNQIMITGMIEKRDEPPSNGVRSNEAKHESAVVFTLTGWKLKAPFLIAHPDLDDITNPPKTNVRSALQRNDFTSSKHFDPTQSSFDPSAYIVR